MNGNQFYNFSLQFLLVGNAFLGQTLANDDTSVTSAPTTVLPSDKPSMLPTEIPLPVIKDTCYDNLNEIYDIIEDDRLLQTMKKFVLCPNTVYNVGRLRGNETFWGIVDGQYPLIPRMNTIFQCGQDGSVENNCVIKGGDWGMISVPLLYSEDYDTSNVLVKGITFESNELFSIFWGLPGTNVTVDDCIVRNDANEGPIVLNNIGPWDVRRNRRVMEVVKGKDYDQYENRWERVHHYMNDLKDGVFDDVVKTKSKNNLRRELNQIDPLYITIQNVVLQNNTQGIEGWNIEYGLVTLRNENHVATFKNNLIIGNNYGDKAKAPMGYFMGNEGSHVNLENNCFADNELFGPGMVIMYPGSTFTRSGNQATTSSGHDVDCQFIISFETWEDESNYNYRCDTFYADSVNTCNALS